MVNIAFRTGVISCGDLVKPSSWSYTVLRAAWDTQYAARGYTVSLDIHHVLDVEVCELIL